MKVVLLGTGNGKADPERYAPSNLVWIDDEPVLVDCGNGVLYRLREAGVHPGRVETVLLTHLHFDHYADYPLLATQPLLGEGAFWREKLEVFGPPGTERLVRNFEDIYDYELDFYTYLKGYTDAKDAVRADVTEIHRNWQLERGEWTISTALVDHGVVRLPSFAYRIDSPDGKSIVFSGDTIPCQDLIDLADGADVLVHECTFPDEGVQTRKEKGYAWNTHSTPSRVAEVAQEVDVDKLVLNHFVGWRYGEEENRHDWHEIAPPVINEHFDGELVIGEDLMEITI